MLTAKTCLFSKRLSDRADVSIGLAEGERGKDVKANATRQENILTETMIGNKELNDAAQSEYRVPFT